MNITVTSKQMVQRLPIAQAKVGNTSESLQNKIRHIVDS